MDLWSLHYEDILIESARERLVSTTFQERPIHRVNCTIAASNWIDMMVGRPRRVAVRMVMLAAKVSLTRRPAEA